MLGAFGLTEPDAGSDAAGISTKAVRHDGGWLINGREDLHLQRRHRHVVRGDAVGAHRSEAGRRTVRQLRRREGHARLHDGPEDAGHRLAGSRHRELYFDDVWVPDDHLVGDPKMGLGQFLGTLEVGRISIAAPVAQPDPGGARPGAGLRQGARAVRAADLEVPGGAVQARRHRHRAGGGALAHVPRRVPPRHRAALPQGSVDGEAEGQPRARSRRRRRRSRSTAASATCSRPRWPASTATPKVLEIGEGTNEIQHVVIAATLGC